MKSSVISSTEHKIYDSASLGRQIKDRLLAEADRRDLKAGHTHPELLWNPDVWVKTGGVFYLLEIKVCQTANGNHKNCSTPFKTALGANTAWKRINARGNFLFIDRVDGADGSEHATYISELEHAKMQTKVLTHTPRDNEIKSIFDWFVNHPGINQ